MEAWGDHILTGLRARLRAIFGAGRFVGAEGAVAIFALPNKFHLEHAEPMREEVAAALSRHFGVPLKLSLVVDETVAAEPAARIESPPSSPSRGAAEPQPGTPSTRKSER